MLDAIKETGKTFHNESDEVVEQAHFRVNAFEKSHGYLVSDRKMQTPNAAEKTTKKDGTFEQRAFAIVLYIHCFSVLCFHVPL